MHKIYLSKGKFSLSYQIPQIFYSVLFTFISTLLLKSLALSDNSILKLKNLEKKTEIEKSFQKLFKTLKIKFIFFYIVNISLLLFFWYFVSTFCAIYYNTQKILIIDSAISFGISMIYPFGTILLITILRRFSLKMKKNGLFYCISCVL